MSTCHDDVKVKRPKSVDYFFALVGNPNVGKSVIFNQYTGLGVQTANYQGTTVKINEGYTQYKGNKIKVVDLPGAYGLGGITEDQRVTRRAILKQKPDCLITIIDATNLQRNLYMVFQLIDMGLPIIVCLNLVDLAHSKGFRTDVQKLEAHLGVPVVETIAPQGKGLDELIEKAITAKKPERKYRYGLDLEEEVKKITEAIGNGCPPYGLSPEAFAFLLMENDSDFIEKVNKMDRSKEINKTISDAKKEIEHSHKQTLELRLATERHGLAGMITAEVQEQEPQKEKAADRMWRLSTHPIYGLAILLFSITVFFALVIGSGLLLSSVLGSFWAAFASPVIKMIFNGVIGHNVVSRVLLWGFDQGIAAALGIGVAFVFPFYLLLSILEDSGYLNSIAFLSDRVAHKMGLHGRSFIPLISGAGCNVPAIMGTRALGNKRERVIASTLITMMPCSARTAVILGSVALFAGIWPTLGIYAITIALIFITGFSLNKVMPGKSTGLVMELFPFRLPSPKTTLIKTWAHLKGFISQAFPMIILGSLIMGLLYETGYLTLISKPISFITVTLLGLPAIVGIVLLAGFLRKEMALELLVVLAAAKFGSHFKLTDLMTKQQIFIFALVVTLYIPCLAAYTVLGRELGWKRASAIAAFTVVLAFTVGMLFNFGFKFF